MHAYSRKKISFSVKANKLILNICTCLRQTNFIYGFTITRNFEEQPVITVSLRYPQGSPVFRKIKILSCPSKFIYFTNGYKKNQISFSNSGYCLLATPKGIVSLEQATRLKLSGVLLFQLVF